MKIEDIDKAYFLIQEYQDLEMKLETARGTDHAHLGKQDESIAGIDIAMRNAMANAGLNAIDDPKDRDGTFESELLSAAMDFRKRVVDAYRTRMAEVKKKIEAL